ncbi:hypothetical protein FOZ63_007279 [Perkinsus olseni]|uniref:Alternative oxidase, mitochondrial n=1 Tax=Perkinsus olseni TaxID=32597 RepID=A0A7J6Q710_PEROL|nr:hypothetical protein FOZ63_007279 [Perkinsus olseni]
MLSSLSASRSLTPLLRSTLPSVTARLSASKAPHFRAFATQPVDFTEDVKDQVEYREATKVNESPNGIGSIFHARWNIPEARALTAEHLKPKDAQDRLAYSLVWLCRSGYDFFSGYDFLKHGYKLYAHRLIFLETIAAIPGMVAALNRHLKSLRRMDRDHGWIPTLIEEAEDERMHLLISQSLISHGWLLRSLITAAQGAFFVFYATAYSISPRFCHRFVGYLEEEAFKTYTAIIEDVENGKIPEFERSAPYYARSYYYLPTDATLLDALVCMRADEDRHRDVNHTWADISEDTPNPFFVYSKKNAQQSGVSHQTDLF